MTDPTLCRLLQAILDVPDNDTLRLIYADRCEELGQPERGEFIRDQVLNRPGSLDLDLLDIHLEAWCPWFQRHDELGFERDHRHNTNGLRVRHLGGQTTYWRRGFLDAVCLTAADWLAHADALTAMPLREVKLTTRPTIAEMASAYARRGCTYEYTDGVLEYDLEVLFGLAITMPPADPGSTLLDAPEFYRTIEAAALRRD